MKKIIILLVLIFSYKTYSQSLSVFNVDTSAFPVMKASFYAFDSLGKQMKNLSPSDFKITENGMDRTILRVSCPLDSAVDISSVLTIDISGSMEYFGLPLAKAAANAWIKILNTPNSECAITSFNNNSYINQDFTTDKNKLYNAVDSLSSSGATSYNAALINPPTGAIPVAINGKHNRIIVFLTDGLSVFDKESEIISLAIANKITIYCLTIGMSAPDSLKSIAEQTGGKWFEHISTKKRAEDIYRTILMTAQNIKPCTIEWQSVVPCIDNNIATEINLLTNNTKATFNYKIPLQSLANFKLSFNEIYFKDNAINKSYDTTIIVTALNSDFIFDNITSSNPIFSIIPTNFVLKSGESKTLTITYTPTDSINSYSVFTCETNLCNASFYAMGYYTNPKANKTLKLIFPNGGESFLVGTDTIIKWKGVLPTDTVKLEYSIDAGITWKVLTTKATGLSWNWNNIPKPASNSCLVRVSTSKAPPIEWQKLCGGICANSIQQTVDGGFIIAGNTNGSKGNYDFLVTKLTKMGNLEWENNYGGSKEDCANSIQQSKDGGYIVGGYTNSNDSDVVGHLFNTDYWVIKLSSTGKLKWQNCLGGSNYDCANSIQELNDGGIIVAGISGSNGGYITDNHGSEDYWIVKLSMTGSNIWEKSFGGSVDDEAFSILQTSDMGYIVAGFSYSSDGDLTENYGKSDYWIVKLSPYGSIEWQKNYGGSGYDDAYSIKETSDGGYIVAGYTTSNDSTVVGNHGESDYWILKLASNGEIQWQKCLGGSKNDVAKSIEETTDGGFIIAGYTYSKDGDVLEGNGNKSAWIVKLSNTGGYRQDVSDSLFAIVEPELTSNDIDMKKSLLGSYKDSVIKAFISNTGGYKSTIDSIYFTGADASAFSISSGLLPFEIPARTSNNMEFRFTPSRVGFHYARVIVISGHDTLITKIRGEGITPYLELSSSIIDFDSVRIGKHKDTIVTSIIKNISASSVNISGIKFLGPNSIDFKLTSGATDTSFILTSGTTAQMTLRFKPSDIGRTSGRLAFYYLGQVSDIIVQLFGIGYKTAPSIKATNPKIINLICESDASDTIKISNTGGDTLKIPSFSITGLDKNNFSLTDSVVNILPDSSYNLIYSFKPNSSGTKTAQIEILSNANPDTLQKISITGIKDSISIVPNIPILNLGTLCPNETMDTTIILYNKGTIGTGFNITTTSLINASPIDSLISINSSQNIAIHFIGSSNEGVINETLIIVDTICGYSHVVNIIGSIKMSKITANDIEMTAILENYKDTVIVINNISDRDITIFEAPVITDSRFKMINANFPMVVLAHTSESILLRYVPTDTLKATISITFKFEPCDVDIEIYVIGYSIVKTIIAYSNLLIGSVSGYPGDLIEIPILLKNRINVLESGARALATDLSFNSTLLVPTQEPKGIISNGIRTITYDNLPILSTSDTLIKIPFIACLGNDSITTLTLSNYSAIGGNVNLTTEDGTFTLLGICKEGSPRLINPNGKVAILAVTPNPVNNDVVIDYSLRENANANMYVINLTGEKVLDVFNEYKNTGEYKQTINSKLLASGVYYIILQTINDIQRKRVEILK